MMQPQRNELKTGNRPVQQQIKSFRDGDVLFAEGSTGRELFIINEGKVGIYKDSPDGKVELAMVEQGGVIGEMSLLDNLPRSATVIAKSDVKALVINNSQFQTIMQEVPVWLQSIIKIVVSRLRDANKRVDQTVLRDRERGVIALIKLLLPIYKTDLTGKMVINLETVTNEICFVCRLRKKEVPPLIAIFEKRLLIQILQHEEKQFIHIPDIDVLSLYEEYLLLKSQKKSFRELSIPPETIGVLSNIAYVAQKHGKESEDGTLLAKQALIKDLSLKDPSSLDKHLSDLSRRSLITIMPSDGGYAIIFKKETLSRIKKIQEWMPRFTMELK